MYIYIYVSSIFISAYKIVSIMMFNVSLHAKSTTLVTFYCRYTNILKKNLS